MEENRAYLKIDSGGTTTIDVNNYLGRVKLLISLHTCASLNELPTNARSVGVPEILEMLGEQGHRGI